MKNIKKIIETGLDDAWDRTDLLPDIKTRLILGIEEMLSQTPIVDHLPTKDKAVDIGFNKAKNADYNYRRVLRDSDHDIYYSGWMDCFDWVLEQSTLPLNIVDVIEKVSNTSNNHKVTPGIYNTVLCSAFCGTGKTFVCEKTDIKAIEIEYWKYKDKGLQREYIFDIKENIGKVEYIFISTDPDGLKLLNKEGYDITLIYPRNELRNEYLDRYIERDSPYEFIGTFMKHWHIWINELKEQKYCKHIVLEKGQYLQDVL